MVIDPKDYPKIPQVAVYLFRLILAMGARRHTLSAYLGSTVRGVFAAAFRRVVCVTRSPAYDGCTMLARCVYPYVFETPHRLTPRRFYRSASVQPYVHTYSKSH
jgi:hypothetical protein